MRKFAIGAIAAGVLLTMGALRVVDLRWSRAETLRSAESRAANLALILSRYVARAFASGDASLRQLAIHSRRIGGPAAPAPEWAPSLASARAGLTAVGAITVVDRAGIIRHSTRPEIVGQSRRSEYVFGAAVNATDDVLIVGTPFPTINVPPQMVIPIGRRLVGRDGAVDGAVVASFLPGELRGFFRTIDVGERGTIWVIHSNGVVLLREPSSSDAIGQSARTNPIFMGAADRRAGLLQGPIDPDGPVMLTAFHTHPTPPFVLAVSLNRDEVLTAWWHEAMASAAVLAAVAAAFGVGLFVLFRQMDAKAAAEAALAQRRRVRVDRGGARDCRAPRRASGPDRRHCPTPALKTRPVPAPPDSIATCRSRWSPETWSPPSVRRPTPAPGMRRARCTPSKSDEIARMMQEHH